VVSEAEALPPNSVVGVNSFGFGGSNVHVILRNETEIKKEETLDHKPTIILLTARTEDGIKSEMSHRCLLESVVWCICDYIFLLNCNACNFSIVCLSAIESESNARPVCIFTWLEIH